MADHLWKTVLLSDLVSLLVLGGVGGDFAIEGTLWGLVQSGERRNIVVLLC